MFFPLFILFLVTQALPGCLTGSDSITGPTEDIVIRHCIITVDGNWTPDYRKELEWAEFQLNAPGLAIQLENRTSWPRPFDLGGDCATYRPEILWLIDVFQQDQESKQTETTPENEMMFFGVLYEGDDFQLSVDPAKYS